MIFEQFLRNWLNDRRKRLKNFHQSETNKRNVILRPHRSVFTSDLKSMAQNTYDTKFILSGESFSLIELSIKMIVSNFSEHRTHAPVSRACRLAGGRRVQTRSAHPQRRPN